MAIVIRLGSLFYAVLLITWQKQYALYPTINAFIEAAAPHIKQNAIAAELKTRRERNSIYRFIVHPLALLCIVLFVLQDHTVHF